jgi:hypothetical protein
MNANLELVLPARPKHLRTLLAATVVALSLVATSTQPAGAGGVVVGGAPITFEANILGKPVAFSIGLPVGAELTTEQIGALIDQVIDRILEKEAALVNELILVLNEAQEILRIIKDTLQFIVIPFLQDVLDDLTGLVVLVKENVFNLCVTVDVPELDPVVCTDAE